MDYYEVSAIQHTPELDPLKPWRWEAWKLLNPLLLDPEATLPAIY